MLRNRAKRWQEPRSDNSIDHDVVAAASERRDGPDDRFDDHLVCRRASGRKGRTKPVRIER
jgi:hypothetical protein